MKHISIINRGAFLGVKSARLVVYEDKEIINEFPLNRIQTISINKRGISLSSDLIFEAGVRGIHMFFLSPRSTVLLAGANQHGVVTIREAQFEYVQNNKKKLGLACKLIGGKISNQRALLMNYNRYYDSKNKLKIKKKCEKLKKLIAKLSQSKKQSDLLGIEGISAKIYWEAIREMGLATADFNKRTGKNATDIFNQALNYGYAILQSYVWNAVLIAGLEPYVGFLHAQRAGNPALIFDIMEEYRSWAVDRNIITLRKKLEQADELTPTLKHEIVASIHETFANQYLYKKEQCRLENILQRQVYNLVARITSNKPYKSYTFKW